MLRVAPQPAKDIEPQLGVVFDDEGSDSELRDETREASAMNGVTEKETRLREDRLAENERALGDSIQIDERLGVQPVARIAERHERRRVDQDHVRRSFAAMCRRTAC